MKVLVGIPCMDNMPMLFVNSLIGLQMPPETEYCFYANSLVYESRNQLSLMAINKNAEYLLMIDSDMTFPRDALTKYLAMDKDIVCGLYMTRRKPYIPVAYSKVYPRTLLKEPGHKAIDELTSQYVDGAGMGFCLIKTEVLRKVWKRYKSPFEPIKGLGEDLSFFYKARKLGYKVWLDTTIDLGHIGQNEVKRNAEN